MSQQGPPPVPRRTYSRAPSPLPSTVRAAPPLDTRVAAYLDVLQLAHVKGVFEREEIDHAALLLLEADDVSAIAGVLPADAATIVRALASVPQSSIKVAPDGGTAQVDVRVSEALAGVTAQARGERARDHVRQRFAALAASLHSLEADYGVVLRRCLLEPSSVVTERALACVLYRTQILETLSKEFSETLDAGMGAVIVRTLVAYCKNYALSVFTLFALQEDARFAAQLDDLTADVLRDGGSPLPLLLSEPVATGIECEQSFADIPELASLCVGARECAQAMERNAIVLAQQAAVRAVQQSLVAMPTNVATFVTQSRRLLQQGSLLCLLPNQPKAEPYYVFLFSDLLLLTQQRESDLRFRLREHYAFEPRTVALERVNDAVGDYGFLLSADLPRLYASSLDEFSDWTVTVLNEFGVSGGLGGGGGSVALKSPKSPRALMQRARIGLQRAISPRNSSADVTGGANKSPKASPRE